MQMIDVLKRLAELDSSNAQVENKLATVESLMTVSNGAETPVNECGGMMGAAMGPGHSPANISITANSGDELSSMLKAIVSLAGVQGGDDSHQEIEIGAPHVIEPSSNDDMAASIDLITKMDDEGEKADDDTLNLKKGGDAEEGMYDNSPDPEIEPHDYGDKQVTPKPQGFKQRMGDNPYKPTDESVDAVASQLMDEYRQFVSESKKKIDEISPDLAKRYRKQAGDDISKAYGQIEKHSKKIAGRTSWDDPSSYDPKGKSTPLAKAMNDPASAGMLDRIMKRKKGISLADKRVPSSDAPLSIADLDSASGSEADYSEDQFEKMQMSILSVFKNYDEEDVLEAIELAGIDPQWWNNNRDQCIRELKGWLSNADTNESAVTELTKGAKWKYTDLGRKSVDDLAAKAGDADSSEGAKKLINKALKRQSNVHKVEKDLAGGRMHENASEESLSDIMRLTFGKSANSQ